jgi:putative peptidoglycan lipid II flippase
MGAAFVTAASGLFAWLELALLRRALARRIGAIGLGDGALARLFGAALLAALLALGAKVALVAWLGADPQAAGEWGGGVLAPPAHHAHLCALACLGLFGVAYLAGTAALGVPEAGRLFRRGSSAPRAD